MTPSKGHVSLVTQWFAPEPVTVPVWLSRSLIRAGWQVSVLTGIPNYPTGEVHHGFSAWRPRRESLNGVNVRRTPLFPSHDASVIRRMANYVSWALSAALFGHRFLRESDVSLVYSSPATAALPALVAKFVYGKPYVLMIQDVWPDSVFASGFLQKGMKRRTTERLVNAFVNATYRHAAHIVAISPGMKSLLEERRVPSSKISLVYNWVDEDAFKPSPPDNSWRAGLGLQADDFVVMYAGNHGAAQGLAAAVDAFGIIPRSCRAHLVLVGDGVEKPGLMKQATRVSPDRVHFLPPRPLHEMAAIMGAADVQLVSLADRPLFHITMPSKVQSILATGEPAIVFAPGDAGQVIQEASAGQAAEPENPHALAKVVMHMLSLERTQLRSFGENGRRYYRREMAESVGATRLSELLISALRRDEPSMNGDQE